jgi:hypothetical protein
VTGPAAPAPAVVLQGRLLDAGEARAVAAWSYGPSFDCYDFPGDVGPGGRPFVELVLDLRP